MILANYRRRPARKTGPVVLRWPARFLWRDEQAPQTDVRFLFPRYPRPLPTRFVGPVALRRPPYFPGTERVDSNTNYVPPTYAKARPWRRTGPMALRGMAPLGIGTARFPDPALPASVMTTSVTDGLLMTTTVE